MNPSASSARLACRRRLPEREDWRPRESYARGGDRCIGASRAVLGVSAPPRLCDPSVLASPADRYGKEVAETENKAKKKLVSHHSGDFNVTRA